MTTPNVQSFVLISMLRGQPKTPPSGDDLAELNYHLNYVNHVLLVILRHMGTFKNVFNILIVHIPGLGRTLHLTKDMNDQMVEFGFQVMSES